MGCYHNMAMFGRALMFFLHFFFMNCNYLQTLFCDSAKKRQLHTNARETLFHLNGTNIPTRDRYAFQNDNNGTEMEMDCEDDELNNGSGEEVDE